MVDFSLIDADNHYYEAEDAFLRFAGDDVKAFIRWISDGRKRRLLFGDRLVTAIPNPTFSPIAKPGAFHQRLKDLEQGGGTTAKLNTTEYRSAENYGELVPLPESYSDRDERLIAMDKNQVERAFLFPTLGVTVEHLFQGNPGVMYNAYHAFNRWLEDDWGYNYQDRLYAAAYVPMFDPERTIQELDYVLERGAKIITTRPGPVDGRSPADPIWDGFWARINEAGVPVAYHAFNGPSAYGDSFNAMWARQPVSDASYIANLASAIAGAGFADRAILDTTIALVLGNLFGRFPNVRIASIEMGTAWVPYALHTLDHAGGLLERRVSAFGTTLTDRPSDVFKEKVFVAPFPEEDIVGLCNLIGADRVIFGSDWPHPEGNVEPLDYLESLEGLDAAGVRQVMRDNALSLVS
jgi:predicted TIM-barrel fold metal-dependent hydrolase